MDICVASVWSLVPDKPGSDKTTISTELNDAIITDYLSNVISQLGSTGTFYRTQTGCNIELNWLITSGYIQSIDKLLIFRCIRVATLYDDEFMRETFLLVHRIFYSHECPVFEIKLLRVKISLIMFAAIHT